MIAIVDYGVGNLFSLRLQPARPWGWSATVTGEAAEQLARRGPHHPARRGRLRRRHSQAAPTRAWFRCCRRRQSASPCWASAWGCSCSLTGAWNMVSTRGPGPGARRGGVPAGGPDGPDPEGAPHGLEQPAHLAGTTPLFRYCAGRGVTSTMSTASTPTQLRRRAPWPPPSTATWPSPAWCARATSAAPSSTRKRAGDAGLSASCGPLRNCKEDACMKIFPAIDLRGGQAVRLYQGDYDQMTVYGQRPLRRGPATFWTPAPSTSTWWIWTAPRTARLANFETIARHRPARAGLYIEVGGGIRTEERIRQYLDLGVGRCILGTVAVEDFAFTERMAQQYGETNRRGRGRPGRLRGHSAAGRSSPRSRGVDFCRRLRDAGGQDRHLHRHQPGRRLSRAPTWSSTGSLPEH